MNVDLQFDEAALSTFIRELAADNVAGLCVADEFDYSFRGVMRAAVVYRIVVDGVRFTNLGNRQRVVVPSLSSDGDVSPMALPGVPSAVVQIRAEIVPVDALPAAGTEPPDP